MMESCLNIKADRLEQMEVDDVKGNLPSEVSALTHPQCSNMEEREHLQVYLRVRPFTSEESSNGESQDCVSIESPDTVLLKPPSLPLLSRLSVDRSLPQTGQRFQFSQVYGPETTQKGLFGGTVKDLVKDVLDGGNSLVFTYGVTNAGKTFTFLGPDADVGILPRSLDVIFSSIDEQVFTGMSIKPQRCREFTRLTDEQQAEEAAFKRNLFRQLKETERNNTSFLNSTNKTLIEGASSLGPAVAAEDRICLQVDTHIKFSVWVSFCEIYNENIHDLLEVVPSGALRRTVLRLSQDVKGNAFVKDLRWIQVNTAEEAYKVMKLGKKNQSFSSTRLNQLSSRSHSVFSIRIMRIEDVGTPRVVTVSELCLCDLAGSERCAKTQNKGERLKEAGNINTSLLILGKCINALRHNQQAKLLQHVPFRESKLTHYLQGFFCGRGKACMIVNINQCASFYEETLNVLKFSAVAQKVVVLSTKPLPTKPQSSASEVSFTGHSAERKAPRGTRRSSLIGWETSLEDVQEDVDDEYEEENVLVNDTVDHTGNEEDENNDKILISKQAHQRQVALMNQLQIQLKKERAEVLLMESRVREEISKEFTELYSEMQNDFNERLRRETEMLEERAETRLEIFKNLIDKMTKAGTVQDQDPYSCELEGLERDAEAACRCLASHQDHANEELERKVLELQHRNGATSGGGAVEMRMHQEKSSENSQLEKEVENLVLQHCSLTDEEGCSHKRDQLQEAMSALEQERKARQDVLSALQYQTEAREEALASLEEERKAKEEAQATVRELRRCRDEMLTSLEKERRDKEETMAELADMKQSREETLAALHEVKSQKEEAQSVLEEERKEMSRLVEESEKNQQRFEQDVRELAVQLEAARQQVRSETERAEQALVQLQAARAELSKRSEEERQSSDKVLNDLKQQFNEQEKTVELLRAELEETKVKWTSVSSSSAAEEELKRLNSDLQIEVTALRAKVANMEEEKETLTNTAEPTSLEMGGTLKEKDRPMEEKLAEVQKNLLEKEAQVTSLLKGLQEAQEQRDEEEIQAVQEARRREAERRRELLAVAHEAIAQKDEELDKKTKEISRLKENAEQDLEKVKSLSVDLQRNEEEASDLREKLADYKKQIQQVQKEISTMREDEKLLRQKLTDTEKTRKQLQSDLANRDRTIQQLRAEQSSDTRSDQTLQLHKACKDLEVKERVIEDMRLALTEQEETQAQMEEVLEEKVHLIQELTAEVEKLKALFRQDGGDVTSHQGDDLSHDLRLAKQEAAQAQESLKLCADKHQAERKKWMEEKLSLIGQAKEAEEKRNQEMRKFVEDRERYTRQQVQMDSMSSQLAEKEQTMERWRKERDTLVTALEVQLQKLLSSQAEKDKLIQELRQQNTQPPQECGGVDVADLQAALRQREADVQRLKEELKASRARQDTVTQVKSNKSPTKLPLSETINKQTAGQRDTRASVSSQGSVGGPSVLDSSEISTENGRTSRFPRPELEISFSPLQPNRMALRRQGAQSAVTVKITRSARKRRSDEMEKSHFYRRSKRRTTREEEVEAENRRNTKTKLMQSLTPQQEETLSPPRHHDSHSSVRSRREGTLQKIGDFLQSSPTLLGSKAKKMMSLVSGRTEPDYTAAASSSSSSSLSLRAKKSKRKLYRPEISSPMDMPPHPIISREAEERESDHQTIKRRLRSRMVK